LINIDTLIESYDVQDDDILDTYWKPIEEEFWHQIADYGVEVNEFGGILSKHLMRTSAIGMAFITNELGFSDKAGRNFYDANLLQDLGKVHSAYDINIWQLPHRPTEKEREEKRLHTTRGNEMIDEAIKDAPEALKNHPHIQVIKSVQKYHHERQDGSGQFGIKGEDLGKIIEAICIIDAFDGDMIHRPHQPAKRTPEQALERLQNGKKYQGAFDPVLLQRFIDFQLDAR
jgi:HD-GYP domain-containing protein (c-di-GMP phosphodiesterase class II)